MSQPDNPFGAALDWAAAGLFVLCAGLVVLAAGVVIAVIVVVFLGSIFVSAFLAAVLRALHEVAAWVVRFCAGEGR